MGPFTLRTDYPVFALGPSLQLAGRAVCHSDALPFVARPPSRICFWTWIHGGMAFCHCRRLPDMGAWYDSCHSFGCCSRAALPVLCAAAPLLCLLRHCCSPYRYAEHDWLACAGRPMYCHIPPDCLHRDSPIPSSAARRENSARKSQDAMRACRKNTLPQLWELLFRPGSGASRAYSVIAIMTTVC